MNALIEKARDLYESRLRKLLEPTYDGQFVAIEPLSGAYFVAPDRLAAYRKGKAAGHAADLVLMRVGRSSPGVVGGPRPWKNAASSETGSRS